MKCTRLAVVVAVLAVALAIVGCGGKKDNALAPAAPAASVVSVPGAHLETVEVDGKQVTAWVTDGRGGAHLQRILYICDYPMGYYGPPSPGHCYEDGTGCTGPPIGGDPDPGWTAPPAPTRGDPTSDDAAPAPLSGDPTADD